MDDEALIAGIEADFPGWHIWKSDTGRWWAARKATLTAGQSSAGCAQYLETDSPTELRVHIAADEALSVPLTSTPPSAGKGDRGDTQDA